MNQPLVTVICLCYNHARFVSRAVQSVLQQDYPHVELWVADDASTDNSRDLICNLQQRHPQIHVFLNEVNEGHCRIFNKVFSKTRGRYIIDLSADDLLMPERIRRGVEELERKGEAFGIHFGDALYIDEYGRELFLHSEKYPHASVPQEDVYAALVSRYFICPTTVMFRREVLEHCGGYDEHLHYEDFDILVRAARKYKFVYSPEVLVKRRIVRTATSRKQFRIFSRHSYTTLTVCRKIMDLNRTEAERRALQRRLWYELRLNMRLLNVDVAWQLLQLLVQNSRKRLGAA